MPAPQTPAEFVDHWAKSAGGEPRPQPLEPVDALIYAKKSLENAIEVARKIG